RHTEYHTVTAAREDLKHRYAAHVVYLEQCANGLLTFYRDANKRARQTPAPQYFADRWRIPTADQQEPAAPETPFDEEYRRLTAALTSRRQQLLAEYEKAIVEYQRIDELTPEDSPSGAVH